MNINYYLDDDDYSNGYIKNTKHKKIKSLKNEDFKQLKENSKLRNKNIKNGIKNKNSKNDYEEN